MLWHGTGVAELVYSLVAVFRTEDRGLSFMKYASYALEWIVPGLPCIIDGDVVSSVGLVNVDIALNLRKASVIMMRCK